MIKGRAVCKLVEFTIGLDIDLVMNRSTIWSVTSELAEVAFENTVVIEENSDKVSEKFLSRFQLKLFLEGFRGMTVPMKF